MKKLSLALCLLVSLLILASCGSRVKLESAVAEMYKESPKLTTVSKISELDNARVYGTPEGVLAAFKNSSEIRVYNVERGEFVLTSSATDLELFSCFGRSFILEHNERGLVTKLYDESGKEIASSTVLIKAKDITVSFDLFRFCNDIYRVDSDGGVEKIKEQGVFNRSLPEFDYANGKYYYIIEENGFVVFDKELEPLYSYDIEASDAKTSGIAVLENGRVLVQYLLPLPEGAKDYDLYSEGEIWDLVTLVINPKNGGKRSVNADYLIGSVFLSSSLLLPEDWLKNIGVKNFGTATLIENGRASANETLVSVGNNGKLKQDINAEMKEKLPLYSSESYLGRISEDVYCYVDSLGDYRLVDGNGKELATLSNGDEAVFGRKYFSVDEKIFDYEFKSVFDLDAEECKVEEMLERSVLLMDNDGAYRIFADGETVLLEGTPDDEVVRSNLLVTVKDKEYFVYNDEGALIGKLPNEPSVVLESEEGYILKSGINYYRIGK